MTTTTSIGGSRGSPQPLAHGTHGGAQRAAALDALADASRRGRPFALVLLDANMPEMDGFAVAEQMAARPDLGGATIMMLTSSGQFGDSTRCRELGIRMYLTKPIRHADLFDAICQVMLPTDPRPAADPPPDSGAPVLRARVLLAEDNIVNQRVAAGLLTRRGHAVDVVANGLDALAAMAACTYDVVLMDVQMPEMGGIEATRIIREREAPSGRHTRVVALTAHAMAGDRERYLESGMDGYLSKPIDPARLFAEVESHRPNAEPEPYQPPLPDGAPYSAEAMRQRLGSDELVAEVVGTFLDDCPTRVSQIMAAVIAQDRKAIRVAAQALVGAALSLSATPVAECASALESIAADETFDLSAADAACARLDVETARLMAALEARVVVPVRDAGQ